MSSATRRELLVVSGTGIASLALPTAAVAASMTVLTPAAEDIRASGGTVTGYVLDGTPYVVHTFTSVGTTTFTPQEDLQVEYLVVAGGGGGGAHVGGGGGGGGVLTNLDGTTLGLTSGTAYTVTVGGGGSGGSHPGGGRDDLVVSATQGGDSRLGDVVAEGGGYGGMWTWFTPGAGGSGGGSGNPGYVGGAATVGQGSAGGRPTSGGVAPTGGGGGAGSVGQDGTTAKAGDGGLGIASTIAGLLVRYGGGGGGGVHDLGGPPAGSGQDGGGDGVTAQTTLQPQQAGTDGLGGGGGGGGHPGSDGPSFGGAGGSGVVIVRYPAA